MIYLASTSERRRTILKSMRVPFKVVKSRYRERMIKSLSPEELVMRHCEGKARKAVLPKTARWVLGSDTVVVCGRKILGKPQNLKEAFQMLKKLSGRSHFVYTGVALWDRKDKKLFVAFDRSRVSIKKLSAPKIRDYMTRVPPLDKAGAYAIQMPPRIVKKIEGSYSNVMGLPRELLRRMLIVMR